jgi:hypothetical protein
MEKLNELLRKESFISPHLLQQMVNTLGEIKKLKGLKLEGTVISFSIFGNEITIYPTLDRKFVAKYKNPMTEGLSFYELKFRPFEEIQPDKIPQAIGSYCREFIYTMFEKFTLNMPIMVV